MGWETARGYSLASPMGGYPFTRGLPGTDCLFGLHRTLPRHNFTVKVPQRGIPWYPLRLRVPLPLEVLQGIEFRLSDDGSLVLSLRFKLTKTLTHALYRYAREHGVSITVDQRIPLEYQETVELDPSSPSHVGSP